MAVPVLMFGSENWTMNKRKKQMVEMVKMKFLRYVAGYFLADHMRNNDIAEQLKTFNLNDNISNYKYSCSRPHGQMA